jgi:predicted  nucleic acid-binding Zn-ribbon protein
MSIARELFELQEVDLEIESNEQAIRQVTARLGESEAVLRASSELASEKERLEELGHRQHSLEWEIGDIGAKLARTEDELYSGRTTNPKELANLQQEASGLKARRSGLEDRTLEEMEQAEAAAARAAGTNIRLEKLEAEWQAEQGQLKSEIEERKKQLTELREKRASLSAGIEQEAIEFYTELRKRKGTAVARVEQGICRGCRISLSSAELQRVRSGALIECTSCGRILFLA